MIDRIKNREFDQIPKPEDVDIQDPFWQGVQRGCTDMYNLSKKVVDTWNTLLGWLPGMALPTGPKLMTNKEAAETASKLGYTLRRSPNKVPFHGQPGFYNPKTKTYISPDVDRHKGGVWKMFDRNFKRLGTYDAQLNPIAD